MEPRHAVRDPKTLMGAQYSLPFATAVALTRDLTNPLAYDENTLWDPEIRDLAKRIELIPVEGSSHPEVTIEFGGEVHTLAAGPVYLG
jgi:2-methylcitrate dehydratase PrpD